MTITPHYNGDNAQALANALKANLLGYPATSLRPFKIKVYDALKAPPSYPLALAEQTAAPPTTTVPREIALCLSYYSTYNRPSYRGRLYLPAFLVGGSPGLRPTVAQRDEAIAFKAVLAAGLPAQHNWVVYSKKLGQSFGVSNVWVDDEWDTVRSRGLRGTVRTLATVP
jgi:hypothetical protein